MKENEAQSTFKARISKFEADVDQFGDLTRAQVIPVTSTDIVTRPFAIFWAARGAQCDLKVDDVVICSRFPDGSGIIWCREDGGYNNTFAKNMTVKGDVQVDGTIHADAEIKADVEVEAAGKKLTTHIHNGYHGQTTPPV